MKKSKSGETGSILSLLCDAGERYLHSYHDPRWVAAHIGDCAEAQTAAQARFV